MTTPENPAAPSARPRKPRAPRQNRPAQATNAAQTAQNPTPDQTPTPAGQDVLEVLVVPDGLVAEEEAKLAIEAQGYEATYSGPDLDEEIASPDPAHPYQRVVRTLLGPGFEAFLGKSGKG